MFWVDLSVDIRLKKVTGPELKVKNNSLESYLIRLFISFSL